MTKYRLTLVYKLDGINMNRIDGEVEVIEDSATGLLAVVASDPDDYGLEGDRWTALANLRLNALFGQPGLEITQERITEQLARIRESRKRTFGTGPYLILMRDAEVEDFSPEFEGETADYIVCSGGPPRQTLRQASRPHVLSTLAAITIATEDLSGIKKAGWMCAFSDARESGVVVALRALAHQPRHLAGSDHRRDPTSLPHLPEGCTWLL